jgi:hypothetical protein
MIEFKEENDIITIKSDTTKNDLEYNIYVKKDYSKSLQICEYLFKHFLRKKNENIKHKCNRDDKCECIYYGKMFTDIYLNLFDTNEKYKKLNFLQTLEKYFANPSINLPFDLFIYVIKALLKTLDFQTPRIAIETYLTYSNLKRNSKDNDEIIFPRRGVYEIDLDKVI